MEGGRIVSQGIVTTATAEYCSDDPVSVQGSALASAVVNAVAEAMSLGGEEQRIVEVNIELDVPEFQLLNEGPRGTYNVEVKTVLL